MNCWPREIDPHIGTMVKTPNPFNLLINILNIYKYHFHNLNQCPWVQIYNFGGLIWPFNWGLGFLPCSQFLFYQTRKGGNKKRVDSVRGGSRTRAFSWGLGTASGAPPSRERTLTGTALTNRGTYFLVCGLALCGSFNTRGSFWLLDWWMKKISIGKLKILEPGTGRQG